MRPPVIVEVNGNCDCADYLLDILEDLVFKQFILHRDYHQKKVIFNYTLTSSYIDTLSPKIEDNLSWIMPAH